MNATDFVTAMAQRGAGVMRGEMPALDSPDAWPTVFELAREHRVVPLVWQALSSPGAPAVPAPTRAAFEEQVVQSAVTRMLCEGTLQRLLATLAPEGLRVLVLKGAAVAWSIHPNPSLRLYNDVDVLCRASDYSSLAATLLASGYTPVTFGPEGSKEGTHDSLGLKPSPAESYSVRGFYDPAGGVKIEVHFDLLQFGLVDRGLEEVWRAARTLTAGALQIPLLSPEHQFLHLASHVHRHCFTRLAWLIDLDLFVRQQVDRLDWANLMRLALDEGMAPIVRHTLEILGGVLGTPMPALPPPTLEERFLAVCYRRLWPAEKVRRLEQREHRRHVRFWPDSADPRNVYPGLLLLGRRREKLQILGLHYKRALGMSHS